MTCTNGLLRWAALLAIGLMLVGGCSRITARQIRSNMTPELDSYAQSKGQSLNDHARFIDHNTRSAWNDLDRVLLLHRPIRLHPYASP